MKRFLAFGTAAVLALGALAPASSEATSSGSVSASSNKKSCVTKKEFAKIRKGMTRAKVKRIVGNDGRLYDQWGGWEQLDPQRWHHTPYYQVRIYKPCRPYSADFSEITVTYFSETKKAVVAKRGQWER